MRSHKKIKAWFVKHTANPIFKNQSILNWFTDFLALGDIGGKIKFLDQLDAHIFDGTITPNWNILGADTGRVTVGEPALGSTPRDPTIRGLVIPHRKGNVFVIADYATIEVVIQAILANEGTMLSVFREGKDLHTFLAAKVRECAYEDLIHFKKTDPKKFKSIRTPMKGVNFGLIYSMGPQTLWQQLLSQGVSVSFDDAQHLHKIWHETFPQIKRYQERCRNNYLGGLASLPRLGGTHYITSVAGRIRRPQVDLQGKTFLSQTQIGNFPIQATCTDFLKLALILLYRQLQTLKLDAHIVLSAHDEIVVECPPSEVGQIQNLLQKTMVGAAQFILAPLSQDAPVKVDIGVGQSWADKP